MKDKKKILIILFDIIFLGAFIAFLPMLIQVFSNLLTAILVVVIMLVGSGIVVCTSLFSFRPKSGNDQR